MKVLIVASSKLPVPAVKGGAVPTLIEELLRQNEKEKQLELECCSLYETEAEKAACEYKHTKFIWARPPKGILWLDKMLGFVLGKLLRVKRLLSASYLFQVLWMSFFVAGVLKRNTYDKVIFENSVPMLSAMKRYGNGEKYADKYYLHMHSVPRKYYGNEAVIRNCKSIICISDYVASAMLNDERLKIEREKISIMYNCIDTALFKPGTPYDPAAVKTRYGIALDKKIVLFVGRLSEEKGIEELLQAVKEIQREDFVLMIVGGNFYKSGIVSPYEEKLREMGEPIRKKLVFTGYVDYDRVAEIYTSADVVVLPSMWEEPAGMTIIEAMACGKPVITTHSGGIPEYVGEGSCIMLQRDETLIPKLAECIEKVMDDPETAERLSQRAYARASRYDQAYYYQQFLSVLSDKGRTK